ncbi:MAG: hypothetical protein ACI4EV_01820 [Lachnospiraceae bacterium]
MAEGNSIRDEIKSEHKKMKDMNILQKIAYIFGYYKLRIFVILIVVAAITGSAIILYKNNYERAFTCVMFDGKLEGTYDRTDYLTTHFTEYLGIDGKSQRVIIDNNFTFKMNGISDIALYDIDTLITRVGGQTVDGYISEYKYSLILNSDEGFFLEDLRDWLTREELEELEDYLIYYTTKSGEKIPLSIEIGSTKFITEAHVEGIERPCFGIVSSSLHKDNAANFIRFLFGMEKRDQAPLESTGN